jgi:hypothetical protein
MGVRRQWPIFKEERANIYRLMQSVKRSLEIYKNHRPQVGLFYLTPSLDTCDFDLRSYFLRMPS